MERIITFIAQPQHNGRTLEKIMKKDFSVSAGLIRRIKHRENSVLVDGKPQFVTYTVREGQEIVLEIQPSNERSENIEPCCRSVDIIFEDEDILVVNKPGGVPCHPVKSNRSETLANFLAAHYEKNGQGFTARIINRLDTNTSGLVMLAKNALSAGILNDMVRQSKVSKTYTAITLGVPPQNDGKICDNIRRSESSAILRQVCGKEEGQTACTKYHMEKVSTDKELSLLKISTLTGRTHQIRVHLSSIGCPLAGDFLYGTENPSLISRHALHMGDLELFHPITKENLHFTASLPEDMDDILKRYF